jgi:hypothetical protein
VSRAFVPAVLALALIAAPAAAQTEPEPTAPCPESEEYVTLGLDGKTEEVDSPPLPSGGQRGEPFDTFSVTNYRYRLDVSGSPDKPFATKANVTIDLEWDNEGDNELRVYDSADSLLGSSTDFLPDYIESVTLIGVPHCTDFRAEIENYIAPPALNMSLKSTVSSLKP